MFFDVFIRKFKLFCGYGSMLDENIKGYENYQLSRLMVNYGLCFLSETLLLERNFTHEGLSLIKTHLTFINYGG